MVMQSSYRRTERRRVTGSRFIISCEGDSEKAYFEAIRQDLNLSKDRIIVLNEKGTDPKTIVRTAIAYRTVLERDGPWLTTDTSWAVFDGDEHIRNGRENWEQALQLAKTKNVRLAVSNPNLELWYLLHFQNQNASLSGNQAEQNLKAHMSDYVKPQSLYLRLKMITPEAIQRATRLAERHEENGLPFYENPSCGIGVLVERLLAISK